MAQPIQTQNTEANWQSFIRRHWQMFALLTGVAVAATASALYLLTWFTAEAQATGLVPQTLNLWSMHHVVIFMVYLALWELAAVGVPIAIAAIAGWQWWKHLPEAEKAGLDTGKKSKGSHAGGAFSLLFFLAFAIKVYLEGNWNQPIASWALDYVVSSAVTILSWAAAIFAIPTVIGVVWWLSRRQNHN